MIIMNLTKGLKMKIKHNTKGYYLQDEKGRIHARHIPTEKMATMFFKEIAESIAGLN